MKIKPPTIGKIITFYSYKGGTGRSMALANIACLLAQRDENESTLMIDWDLEAPGLHRYFQNQISSNSNRVSSLEVQSGLIDFFYEVTKLCTRKNLSDDDISSKVFDEVGIEKFIIKTKIPSLYLMTAGKLDDSYSSKVASFNWESLFDSYPSLIHKFSEYLAHKFKYVLIDSRTGHTDISGICTTLMPDKLVVVFTPNNQSITGAVNITKKAINYRKQSDDLRQLIVFPLVSRVEPAEPKLREEWRFGNSGKKIDGYQVQFENLFKDSYMFANCDLTAYFDDVQVQYVPRYSYGEEIAVISERSEDRLSLAKSYENFVTRLIDQGNPWISSTTEKQTFLSEQQADEKSKSGRIEKTVFISYRRSNHFTALAIYQYLTQAGFDVFFDYASVSSGDFEQVIVGNIKARAHFLVVLSPSAIERFSEPNDWMRREIETAIDEKRNIVPLFMEGFDFASPTADKVFTGKISALKNYNGLRLPAEYFFEAMDKLRVSFLNTPIDTTLLPISNQALKVTENQKSAANSAEPVKTNELSALEWFEKGFRLNNNSEEEILAYTQAILLEPSFAEAYANRGMAKKAVKDIDGAIFDFQEALRLKPHFAEVYNYLGETYADKGNFDIAIESFTKAIQQNPDSSAVAFNNRGNIYFKMGAYDAAIKDYSEAIYITPEYANLYYLRAKAWELKKDYYSAIADYQKYLEASGNDKDISKKIDELKNKIKRQ